MPLVFNTINQSPTFEYLFNHSEWEVQRELSTEKNSLSKKVVLFCLCRLGTVPLSVEHVIFAVVYAVKAPFELLGALSHLHYVLLSMILNRIPFFDHLNLISDKHEKLFNEHLYDMMGDILCAFSAIVLTPFALIPEYDVFLLHRLRVITSTRLQGIDFLLSSEKKEGELLQKIAEVKEPRAFHLLERKALGHLEQVRHKNSTLKQLVERKIVKRNTFQQTTERRKRLFDALELKRCSWIPSLPSLRGHLEIGRTTYNNKGLPLERRHEELQTVLKPLVTLKHDFEQAIAMGFISGCDYSILVLNLKLEIDRYKRANKQKREHVV